MPDEASAALLTPDGWWGDAAAGAWNRTPASASTTAATASTTAVRSAAHAPRADLCRAGVRNVGSVICRPLVWWATPRVPSRPLPALPTGK